MAQSGMIFEITESLVSVESTLKNEQLPASFSWRRANEADAPALTALVLRAKAHWGYPQEWMDAWRAELTVTSDSLRNIR